MNKLCALKSLIEGFPKYRFNRLILHLNESSWSGSNADHSSSLTSDSIKESKIVTQNSKPFNIEYSENAVLRQCAEFETFKNSVHAIEIESDPVKRTSLCQMLIGEIKILTADVGNDKLVRENESLRIKLETATESAAKLEFLLLYRNKLIGLEKHYVTGMPKSDAEFLAAFRGKNDPKDCFKLFKDEQILGKKHFRNWFWLLNFGDEINFTQLGDLRKLLKKNVLQYHWFSDKMQVIFELLSEENHSEGFQLGVKYIIKSDVRKYIKFLSPDSQVAAEIFFKSEKWIN